MGFWKWILSNAAWDIPFEVARKLLGAEGDKEWMVTVAAWALVVFALLGVGISLWFLSRLVVRRLRVLWGSKSEDLAAVYYLDALGIVDMYIETAISGMSDMARLSIRNEFIDNFEQTPGAMLGDGKFNRIRFHQWMKSNAARFLVENRRQMK